MIVSKHETPWNFSYFCAKIYILMRNTDTFRQYTWLVNTVQRAKSINFEQIGQMWVANDMNNGKPLSRTTFYRLRQAIEDMFGLRIECDNRNQYYISNPETLSDNSTQNWMLRTLTVNSLLLDGLSIKDQLLLEDIPAGLEHLETVINAIKNHHTLRMGYKKFSDSKPYSTSIEPYCLKLFHQRWYLLGKTERKAGDLGIFALDRMTELTDSGQCFVMDSKFHADSFFKHYFGVFIGENEKPTRIVLRAYGKMIPLIRTLPKHSSQKEIATTETYSDFEFYLAPTFDFRQEILKEGPELEVIEPKSLRKKIHDELVDTLKRYKQPR